MKLSIITVNLYNAPGLLKTIKSVVSQTSRDFEYIIIDGGSTDGSVEVIRSFTDIAQGIYKEVEPCALSPEHFSQPQPDSPDTMLYASCPMPITYWVSEPDRGIYHAMNKGIMVAKGEYCQFLNSGDWLVSSDVIEKMLGTLPECSIYYGNMLKQMHKGKIFRDTGGEGNITMLTFYKGTLNHSPALIKRNLFEKYGLYDEALKIVSDWKWYITAIGFHNESISYVNMDVTYFNINGISNTNKELEKQERRKVLEELLPISIIVDYDLNWRNIDKANRIKRYKLAQWVFGFIERILFKLDKWKNY